MKRLITAILLLFTGASFAQLTSIPSGGNKVAMVKEQIGLTDVTVNYVRPGVKGREGKIWGPVVHYGFKDLGYGTSKAAPWRAGANENTTIEFSNPVKVEGQDIPAGKYGFFIDVEPDRCVLIFNKRTTSWGSFFYDPKEDALKVPVKQTMDNNLKEWLQFEFSDQTANSAVLSLVWEKWKIPFKIETDLVKDQMEIFKKELTSSKSSDWKNWNQAAKFALDNNYLEEATLWNNQSLNMPFVGNKNFSTLSTKSGILEKTGKKPEADSAMKSALAVATKDQIFNYGITLIKKKDTKKALEVFKLGYDKYPNEYLSQMGLARGYSAIGEFDRSLAYAKTALKLAPDEPTRSVIQEKIILLEKKQDIN